MKTGLLGLHTFGPSFKFFGEFGAALSLLKPHFVGLTPKDSKEQGVGPVSVVCHNAHLWQTTWLDLNARSREQLNLKKQCQLSWKYRNGLWLCYLTSQVLKQHTISVPEELRSDRWTAEPPAPVNSNMLMMQMVEQWWKRNENEEIGKFISSHNTVRLRDIWKNRHTPFFLTFFCWRNNGGYFTAFFQDYGYY